MSQLPLPLQLMNNGGKVYLIGIPFPILSLLPHSLSRAPLDYPEWGRRSFLDVWTGELGGLGRE